MAIELDFAGDFAAVVDGLKRVVVDGIDVNACLRRAVSVREAAASGGKYLTSDTAFHLDVAEIPEPSIGGKITDVDGEWTILSVDWHTLVNRWRCVSRKLSISGGVTVTIQRATYAKGTTGAEEPTWATLASNVSAKVHLLSAEVETENTNRTSRINARVYFAAAQSLGPADRILTTDDMTLKVLSWDGFDETAQFFAATCEVSKWPRA